MREKRAHKTYCFLETICSMKRKAAPSVKAQKVDSSDKVEKCRSKPEEQNIYPNHEYINARLK